MLRSYRLYCTSKVKVMWVVLNLRVCWGHTGVFTIHNTIWFTVCIFLCPYPSNFSRHPDLDPTESVLAMSSFEKKNGKNWTKWKCLCVNMVKIVTFTKVTRYVTYGNVTSEESNPDGRIATPPPSPPPPHFDHFDACCWEREESSRCARVKPCHLAVRGGNNHLPPPHPPPPTSL